MLSWHALRQSQDAYSQCTPPPVFAGVFKLSRQRKRGRKLKVDQINCFFCLDSTIEVEKLLLVLGTCLQSLVQTLSSAMPQLDLVNATDLARWADRLDARARLPELIRRLLSATGVGLIDLKVRASEGVQLSGWDGIARATGSDVYAVEGLSVWEMGTDKGVTQKANSDYTKRSEKPNGVDPSTSIYVFVTPRRWPGKENWIEARNADSVWKKVRAYDADDLETWLSRAPGVHAWFSVQLGKDPYEVESLETWWDAWSQATAPPIPSTLLLPGRTDFVSELELFVQQSPSSYTISADSQEEAVAFVAAVFRKEDNLKGIIERALIVRTPSAWRRLAVSEHRLILLALFDGADVGLGLRGGHHVIVPVGQETGAEVKERLPRLHRDGVEAALKDIVPDAKLAQFATLGRKSLLSLRRAMAISRVVHTPEWSRPEHARDILPILLAGCWRNGHQGDQMVLTKLAARPYNEVANILMRWVNSSDPPVRRVSDVWLIAAKQDAWMLIARYLTSEDLSRFREVVVDVLTSAQSTTDTSSSSPFLTAGMGQGRPYSSHLVAGLADTLALMGAISEDVPLIEGWRSSEIAAGIVHELLASSNAAGSEGWLAISSVLPALAEAAPEVFLEGVEAGLSGSQPLAGVFQDGPEAEHNFLFGSSSAHCSLLWALEALAWSREYIAPVTLALSKLASIDPGGRLANRPINSLYNIHVLWSRGTAASTEERMHALDVARRNVPTVAWRLLLRLLPISGSCSPPNSPVWRDWKSDGVQGMSTADVRHRVEIVCERLLKDVTRDATRWAELIYLYTDIPLEYRERIIEALQELAAAPPPDGTRRVITEAIRNLTIHHRAYPRAKRPLSAPELEPLESLTEQLQPTDALHRHQWLFVSGAPVAFRNRGDRQQRVEALEEAQIQAVKEIHSTYGLKVLIDWVGRLDNSLSAQWVGNGLASVLITPNDVEAVLDLILADGNYYSLAYAFIRKRAAVAENEWIEWVKGIVFNHPNWSVNHLAYFVAAFPANTEIWDMVEARGIDTDRAYWTKTNHYVGPSAQVDDYLRAARKMIEHGRAHTAIDLLDLYRDEIEEQLPADLVAEALEQAATTAPIAPFGPTYKLHVGRLLDWLSEKSFDRQRMASLEWLYVSMFSYPIRRFPVLHTALASNPREFVAVISLIYRAEGEDEVDLFGAEKNRMRAALDLLESWRDVPGANQDGTIDQARLFSWVTEARQLLSESGRLSSGDHRIGRILRYGPPPRENEWPCEAIRDLIEDLASISIEDGLYVEVYNSRGLTGRNMTEGGDQERALEEQYRHYAQHAASQWPRTASLLRRIAASYNRDARMYDTQADLTQDLWK